MPPLEIKKKIHFFILFVLVLLNSGSLRAETETKIVRVSFEIEPVTVMKVASNLGVGAVRLGPISPRAEVPSQALEVSILTNTHHSYQVYHRLEGEISNAEGAKFPSEKILFMVTRGKEGGNSEFPGSIPVPTDETLIFRSKPEGGSDTFQVVYSVENTKLFEAGLYYGNIYFDIRTE